MPRAASRTTNNVEGVELACFQTVAVSRENKQKVISVLSPPQTPYPLANQGHDCIKYSRPR